MPSLEQLFSEYLFNEPSKVTENYEAGEYLYRNGTPAIGVFFICTGKVKIILQRESGFLSQEIKSSGDIIALEEMKLLYYITDAVALEVTEVYFFDRYLLLEFLKEMI